MPVAAGEGNDFVLVGIGEPVHAVGAEGGMVFPQLDQVVINFSQLRTFLGVPENI